MSHHLRLTTTTKQRLEHIEWMNKDLEERFTAFRSEIELLKNSTLTKAHAKFVAAVESVLQSPQSSLVDVSEVEKLCIELVRECNNEFAKLLSPLYSTPSAQDAEYITRDDDSSTTTPREIERKIRIAREARVDHCGKEIRMGSSDDSTVSSIGSDSC